MPTNPAELKNVDVTNTALIIASQTTATVQLLNGVAQDSTANGRVGRRIVMKSLYYRFTCALAPTTAGSASIRLLIVYDKQTNATATTAALVLTSDQINAMNLLDNARRFVTLVDKVIPCMGTGGPGSVTEVGYKKLNLPVEFNAGTTAVIGSIQTGSVYLLAFQAGNLITTNPSQTFQSRIRYTDI